MTSDDGVERLTVRNWAKFQHYKGRRPPWIKLHRGLLDDFSFSRLPLASRALAPYLWLLASESEDGTITAEVEELAFRLRAEPEEVVEGVNGLIRGGFIDGSLSASKALAICKQDATPDIETEKETERDKRQKRIVPSAPTALVKHQGGWVAKAVESWPGVVDHGRAGKALSPVVKKYGAEATLSGLSRWLAAGNAKFGPEVFATDSEAWILGSGTGPSAKAKHYDDLVRAGAEGGLRGK